MASDITKELQKRKKKILEDWMNLQVADASLREDLMSNHELREQSEDYSDFERFQAPNPIFCVELLTR